ncbi:hypothetical protein BLA29_006566 [Euroglyphus maynei]|uniref:Uncharacterized protein n=1 Tax=Euroglyphus maynei TaxID=6958 RepID=A0A1Y3B010_EURMA|nr:hypothetical protein BLA29_006566 [Euroglyphus maynei]
MASIQLFILIYVECQINQMKDKLRDLSKNASIKINRYRSPLNCGQKFPFEKIQQFSLLHREHIRLCVFFSRAYQELWGPILFVFIMFSIPINVVSLVSLRLLGDGPDKIQIYLPFIIHSYTIIAGLSILTVQTRLLHCIKKYFPNIIPAIKWSRLKFRYENWYERLMHGKKYGPSFEPFGTITGKTILNTI